MVSDVAVLLICSTFGSWDMEWVRKSEEDGKKGFLSDLSIFYSLSDVLVCFIGTTGNLSHE